MTVVLLGIDENVSLSQKQAVHLLCRSIAEDCSLHYTLSCSFNIHSRYFARIRKDCVAW